MRLALLAAIVASLACNESSLRADGIKTVEYRLVGETFLCLNADSTYLRDVNSDGSQERACFWDCAFDAHYGVVGAYEVSYGAAGVGSVTETYIADCQ